MSIQLEHVIGYCNAVADSALDGNVDALVAFAQLKAVAACAADGLKKVDPLAITAAEAYPTKTFDHAGLKFTRKDGSRTFKFDHIERIASMMAEVKAEQEKAKNAALQMERGLMAVSVDGEVVEPARIEYSKSSLTLG